MFHIGLAITFLSIIVGFAAEGGNLFVLLQPYAALIIIGSAFGIFIVSNTKSTLKLVYRSIKKIRRGHAYQSEDYKNLLIFLFFFFKFSKTKSLAELETHIEAPYQSSFFKKYPDFMRHREALTFFCDYMRMLTLGYDNHYELENMMQEQIAVKVTNGMEPSNALFRLGDTLPALGILAAVLGVINAMASIDQPPEIMGQKIASALIGTFLGVAVAYCIVNPIGSYLEKIAHDEAKFLECIKAGFIAHIKGNPPSIAIEFARQAIPANLKPSFYEIERVIENQNNNKRRVKNGRRK